MSPWTSSPKRRVGRPGLLLPPSFLFHFEEHRGARSCQYGSSPSGQREKQENLGCNISSLLEREHPQTGRQGMSPFRCLVRDKRPAGKRRQGRASQYRTLGRAKSELPGLQSRPFSLLFFLVSSPFFFKKKPFVSFPCLSSLVP